MRDKGTFLKTSLSILSILIMLFLLTACNFDGNIKSSKNVLSVEDSVFEDDNEVDSDENGQNVQKDVTEVEENERNTQNSIERETSERFLVAIDAGHQKVGNSEKEPIGPGASEMKAKVASGTKGDSSGLNEYELTLQLAQKLEAELKYRGYDVLMVRTTNDVDISNAQRAMVANQAGADAFIRIHANGSEDTSTNGAMTICQTPSNPYNASIYPESRRLSERVLNELVQATGCRKQNIWETDTMSGINWCQIPTTIVEVGYMTNPQEDLRMASESYQKKITEGLANGIESFFQNQ